MKVVYLSDNKMPDSAQISDYFEKISQWAKINCKSYINFTITNVSNDNNRYRSIAEFRFNTVDDAFLFEITWK